MKCSLCHTGDCTAGHVTTTLTRGEAIFIIKNVPAMVCEQCGHYYLSAQTTREVLQKGNAAIANGSELEVINLKAA
jgi:YgiT-type zinc finger domain-containing protein